MRMIQQTKSKCPKLYSTDMMLELNHKCKKLYSHDAAVSRITANLRQVSKKTLCVSKHRDTRAKGAECDQSAKDQGCPVRPICQSHCNQFWCP